MSSNLNRSSFMSFSSLSFSVLFFLNVYSFYSTVQYSSVHFSAIELQAQIIWRSAAFFLHKILLNYVPHKYNDNNKCLYTCLCYLIINVYVRVQSFHISTGNSLQFIAIKFWLIVQKNLLLWIIKTSTLSGCHIKTKIYLDSLSDCALETQTHT